MSKRMVQISHIPFKNGIFSRLASSVVGNGELVTILVTESQPLNFYPTVDI